MQTNFTPKQLKNPRISEANDILRKCVHCGLCTATCPTYVLNGDERDSPRGRIYMIKQMFEGGGGADRSVTRHVDRCLSCLSCVTSCPSGVDYMHLVDLARAHIEETAERQPRERFVRRLLANLLPHQKNFRRALWAALAARPFKRLIRAAGWPEIAAMIDLAPARPPRRAFYRDSGTLRPANAGNRRVALFKGCVQQALRPDINDATIRVMLRHDVEIVIPEGQGCCGALAHHLGRQKDAQAQAMRNVDVFSAAMQHKPLDAVIVNASGCGTMMKDYAHLLSRDQAYASRARRCAALTKDISKYLTSIGLGPPLCWSDITVAYHSACSLRNGQAIDEEPRALLEEAGFKVVELAEAHMCCGSAGTYNILQPQLSSELLQRKAQVIARARPDVVATGNIGCIMQLQGAVDVPVVHTIELIDWALGGPLPRDMKALAARGRAVTAVTEESEAVKASWAAAGAD